MTVMLTLTAVPTQLAVPCGGLRAPCHSPLGQGVTLLFVFLCQMGSVHHGCDRTGVDLREEQEEGGRVTSASRMSLTEVGSGVSSDKSREGSLVPSILREGP